MALFVVQHQHTAEVCPAGHPQMGPMLLKHISQENAAGAGVTVHSEAVVDGAHTFYLILESESEAKVREFMGPFAQMGTVEVWPASACERVVARGKC